jgi:hypothetical protein
MKRDDLLCFQRNSCHKRKCVGKVLEFELGLYSVSIRHIFPTLTSRSDRTDHTAHPQRPFSDPSAVVLSSVDSFSVAMFSRVTVHSARARPRARIKTHRLQ